MTTRKIIIDTDPGRDDAVALLLALASPELEVVGIVAAAGNVSLHHTERNARGIVELAGRRDVPVRAGAERPMAREIVTAEMVHGPTGLGNYRLAEPRTPGRTGGIDFIIEEVMSAAPGTITLCLLGPLTDVATALMRAPEIGRRIREIVFMGCAYSEVGNVTPSAEFNVHADPEAAELVLKSGIPITAASLDMTHRALASGERVAKFAAIGNEAGAAAAMILDYPYDYDLVRFDGVGSPLHDPCVIAYLLEPSLFRGKRVNVSVETKSELTLGTTVVDWWQATDRPQNVNFLREVDADGYFALLTERIARLP
jgi:purine nucleosidase